MFNDDSNLVDLDEKLSELIEDFAAACEWLRGHAEDADGFEDLHKCYVAITQFLAPTPPLRIETFTANGMKRILIFRGLDHVETIEIDPHPPSSVKGMG